MERRGIDISSHNINIDYNKLKHQIDFAMVRTSFGFFNEDNRYKEHIKGLENNNIDYGLYHYSYAVNLEQAKKEADGFIALAKTLNPTYPLAIDMEDIDGWKAAHGNPSNETLIAICDYFCKRLEEAGYYALIYANLNYLTTRLNSSILDKYDKWLAQWNSKPTYDGMFGIWQYTDDGSINGIPGKVDLNIAYYDYPTIIKEKNLNQRDKSDNAVPSPKTKYQVGDQTTYQEINASSINTAPSFTTRTVKKKYRKHKKSLPDRK